MKKSAMVLAMMLALSVFTFVGCSNNDKNAEMDDNGTKTEQADQMDQTENNDGVVDETEKGAEDIGDTAKNDANDLGNAAKDGAKDMGKAINDGMDDLGDGVEDIMGGNSKNANNKNGNNQ